MADQTQPPADTLNEVGVLVRREIEARIVAPLIERLGEEFGHDRVTEIARDVVIEVAQTQGAALSDALGSNDLSTFSASMDNWTKGGALETEVIEHTDEVYAFNVTRCRYAEMYKSLGIAELGALFSCNRDATMVEGFNPNITFERTQTIMGGASHCDFRYTLGPTPVEITNAPSG